MPTDSEDVSAATDGDAVASSSVNVPHEDSATSNTFSPVTHNESFPPLSTLSLDHDATAVESAEQEGLSATVAAHDQQPTAIATTTSSTEGTSSAPVSTSQNESSASRVVPQPQTVSAVKLPVDHTYYFIQIFDADNQVLSTVGSFFSKLDANVKASIRRHLQRPLRQDFLMWKRVDGAAITTVSPADSFDDVVSPHGVCFIIGDKMTKDK